MKDTLFIGLCSSTGPGSGKSYIAQLIKKWHEECNEGKHLIKIMSFAEPLKEISTKFVKNLCGYETSDKNKFLFNVDYQPKTYRDILISLGNAMREYSDSYWIKNLDERYHQFKYLESEPINNGYRSIIVIDDVRYQNESNYIRFNNGLLFNIYDEEKELYRDTGDLNFNYKDIIKVPNRRNDYTEDNLFPALFTGIIIYHINKKYSLLS